MIKIVKRKRKLSPNPKRFLRLHRAEYGQKFNSELNMDHFYPNNEDTILRIKKYFNLPKNLEIILGHGAESIIKDIIILHSQKNKNKRILIYNPNYYMYEHFAKVFGYNIYKHNLNLDNHYFIKASEILKNVKKNKINLLCLVNPSAPLEKLINDNELITILEYSKKNNITVILDEVYAKFNKKNSLKFLNFFPNLIIVKSFSKMLGYPGIRAGLAICKKNIFLELDSLRLSIEISSNTSEKIEKILKKKGNIKKIEKNIKDSFDYAKKELLKKNYKVYNKNINSIIFEVKNIKIKNEIIKKLNKKKILTNYSFSGKMNKCISFTTTNKKNIDFIIKQLNYYDN